MAFACPFCDKLSGETFVHEALRRAERGARVRTKILSVPIYEGHWYVDDGQGFCPERSREWAVALKAEQGLHGMSLARRATMGAAYEHMVRLGYSP